MTLRCPDPKFVRSWVEADQISLTSAFQGSISQWLHQKSVGQPLILIGSCSSKLFTVPHEVPLKIIAVFERHGVGNVPKLYIRWEMDCQALVCDDMEHSNPDSLSLIMAGPPIVSDAPAVHGDVHTKAKTSP